MTNTNKYLKHILMAFMLLTHVVFAGQGSAGAKFLQINASTLGTANGGSLIARTGILDAVFYNPASIASLLGFHGNFYHSRYFADMSYDQTTVAYRLPIGTISAGLMGLFSGEMEETTEEMPDGTGRMFAANDYAAQLSYARKFTNKFSGGFTIKYVIQNIDKLNATGLAFDMGAIYETGILNSLTIGFALRNFGKDLRFTGENLQDQTATTDNPFEEGDAKYEWSSEEYSLPIGFELGATFTVPLPRNSELIPTFSVKNIMDQAEFFAIGCEMRMGEYFYVAGGHGNVNSFFKSEKDDEIDTDIDLAGNMRGFCGGFGVNLQPVFNQSIWIAYSFEDHKYLSPIQSIGVSLQY